MPRNSTNFEGFFGACKILKKFIEFFGTFKRKAFDACKIFNFAAEETEFPPASEIYDFRKVRKCLQNRS
ncbi:hypothetical protein ASJ80_05205 [Methanobacterium bryantii]|uniref:Uncharacterized protein n=1 Tax=Methanobacterium bryantii TaxID=2161 RepID=A0A2A2H4C2_METBR|nr:hypothetical protein ASJ80_05205 [Methanobacterium bryantii]